MENKTFNTENLNNLRKTCLNMVSIIDENTNGDLTYSQLMLLGKNIRDFIENPIIENSGLKTNLKS